MADVSADEFLSATKCISERFHIDKFRAIIAGCRSEFNLLKGKDVLVPQPTA